MLRLVVILALLVGLADVARALLPASAAGTVEVSQTAKLHASDGALLDGFGVAVAVAGDTAVIGADLDDDNGLSSGSAYVFLYNGMVWEENAKLTASDGAEGDLFGRSVAVAGDTVVVGAALDDDRGNESGSAYVFFYSGTAWEEDAKLTASDGGPFDLFGQAVAVAGDTALVGAEGDDGLSGSAYVFFYNGMVWEEDAKLTASDGAQGDLFGRSVAVAGDTALVGADDQTGAGAVYVFRHDGMNWSEEAKLMASDGAQGDLFGRSLAVAGDTALVGARGDDDQGSASGSAYVFFYDGTAWEEEAKLTASDGAQGDGFGGSVALAGVTIVVGSSGSAYVFRDDGTDWVEEGKLKAMDGALGNLFGASVAVTGDTAIVGASRDAFIGAAYVFSVPEPSASLLHAAALAVLACLARRALLRPTFRPPL